MRVAIIADVHANRQALEAVLAAASAAAVDAVWCLGDVVGYGGDPDACVELVRERASVCLAGNHDLAVTGALSVREFSDVARKAAEWTRAKITADTRAFLQTLVPFNEDQEISLYHGSPNDPVWEYVLSPVQAEAGFAVQQHRICAVGHTHVALAYHRQEPGETAAETTGGTTGETTGETRHAGERLDVSSGHWLLNPGSVGQPRDGDPRAAWLELDTVAMTALYRRSEYDIDAAAWAIRAARLPHALADRLGHGQ